MEAIACLADAGPLPRFELLCDPDDRLQFNCMISRM